MSFASVLPLIIFVFAAGVVGAPPPSSGELLSKWIKNNLGMKDFTAYADKNGEYDSNTVFGYQFKAVSALPNADKLMPLWLEKMGLEYLLSIGNAPLVLLQKFTARVSEAEHVKFGDFFKLPAHPLKDLANDLKRIKVGTMTHDALSEFRVGELTKLFFLQAPFILQAAVHLEVRGESRKKAKTDLELLKKMRADLISIGKDGVAWPFVNKWDKLKVQWERIMKQRIVCDNPDSRTPFEAMLKEISEFNIGNKPDSASVVAAKSVSYESVAGRESERARIESFQKMVDAATKLLHTCPTILT